MKVYYNRQSFQVSLFLSYNYRLNYSFAIADGVLSSYRLSAPNMDNYQLPLGALLSHGSGSVKGIAQQQTMLAGAVYSFFLCRADIFG